MRVKASSVEVRCQLSRRQQVLYEEFMQRRETQRVLKRGDYISMMGRWGLRNYL